LACAGKPHFKTSFLASKKPPAREALCKTIDLSDLMSVPSQAVIAPLAEELTTEKATQGAGNRLEGHSVFLEVQTKLYLFYHRLAVAARFRGIG
jgi:hypothetical protein